MVKVEEVQEAVQFLANRCDGANSEDGQGYNKADSGFGKSLAAQENWTEKQTRAALKMLKKYKKQLKTGGIDTESLFKEKYSTIQIEKKEQPKKEKKKNKAVIIGKKMELWFSFDWDVLALIKSLPGRKFQDNSRGKYWVADACTESIEKLKNEGFDIVYDKTLPENKPAEKKVEPKKAKIKNIDEIGLKKTLYPYQKEGVEYIEKKNGRALLGDEMGLGKTIQALAWLGLHPEKRPAIVLCPAHLKLNWAKEVKETLPGNPKVQILQGKAIRPLSKEDGDIIIINYDILTHWVNELKKLKPEVLIFDEAHFIKNNKTQRTKATKKLAKGIPYTIAITGTPLVNRPIEVFNIAQIINKNVFPNWFKFVHEFCGAHHNGFGWDYSGATNKEKLFKILTDSFMIRRKKAEVLPQLPAKVYSYVPMEITNKKEYARAEGNFIKYLKKIKGEKEAEKAKRAEHLVKIEALKQLAVKGKTKMALKWINDFITSGNGDSKLVVFATHKTIIEKLMTEFKDTAVCVDGSCSAEQRNKAVESFQNNPEIKLFVGNIQAAGTGLTLTAASSVAFLELPWAPGELVQAEDRCHRIGQKDTVNVYYLLAENSIEYKIAQMLDDKRAVLDAVLDGKEVEEKNMLTTLMESYKEV